MPIRSWGISLREKRSHDLGASGQAPIVVTRVAHEVWGDDTRLGFHSPKLWLLALCLHGEVSLARCRFAGRFGPGHLVIFSPHDSCVLEVMSPSWECYLLNAYGYGLRNCMRAHLGLATRAIPLDNAHRCEQVLAGMHATAADHGPFAQEICALHLEALIHLAHQGSMREHGASSGALLTFARCKAFIDQHFTTLATAQDIAAACSVNRAYLSRLFRTYADDSPYAYLQRLKMNHAAHLLVTTEATLQTIAQQLGYADGFSFSKAFSRQFGLAPSNYRARPLR